MFCSGMTESLATKDLRTPACYETDDCRLIKKSLFLWTGFFPPPCDCFPRVNLLLIGHLELRASKCRARRTIKYEWRWHNEGERASLAMDWNETTPLHTHTLLLPVQCTCCRQRGLERARLLGETNKEQSSIAENLNLTEILAARSLSSHRFQCPTWE